MRHLFEDAHEIPAHDALDVVLTKAGRPQVVRDQPNIPLPPESGQHARNAIEISAQAQVRRTYQVSDVSSMARESVDIGGPITSVTIWPEAHEPTRSRYGKYLVIVEIAREILDASCPGMRCDNRMTSALGYIVESRRI